MFGYLLLKVCAPGNSAEVVSELAPHPAVLADVLSLSAASDAAKMYAFRGVASDEANKIPCIEALRNDDACAVPDDSYQVRKIPHAKGVAIQRATC